MEKGGMSVNKEKAPAGSGSVREITYRTKYGVAVRRFWRWPKKREKKRGRHERRKAMLRLRRCR